MQDTKTFPIVIVGHIDHGKSTLIGRLLYNNNSLSAEKTEEIKADVDKDNGFEFAHLIDYLEEERTRNMTIDTSQIFFNTTKRPYVIIDAPGHKELIKNMITGSSQAEAALLIIDVNEGIKEQTKRHSYILKILGLKQVCVLVNKMDAIDYSAQEFDNLKSAVSELLKAVEITPSAIIPVSAYKGDNITSPSENMDWFDGPTLTEALDNFTSSSTSGEALRFCVQDIYKRDSKPVIVGRVEAGSLKKGQQAVILPSKETVKINTIEKYLEEDKTEAWAGESIGLTLEGNPDIKRGDFLTEEMPSAHPAISKSLEANMFWMSECKYNLNEPLLFKCATQEIKCRIETIKRLFDPAFADKPKDNLSEINLAEVAQVQIELDSEAVFDKFKEYAETGRFVLEKKGVPVAGGIIL